MYLYIMARQHQEESGWQETYTIYRNAFPLMGQERMTGSAHEDYMVCWNVPLGSSAHCIPQVFNVN
jgi:hypothetical protein